MTAQFRIAKRTLENGDVRYVIQKMSNYLFFTTWRDYSEAHTEEQAKRMMARHIDYYKSQNTVSEEIIK